jgi:hypothetical protein
MKYKYELITQLYALPHVIPDQMLRLVERIIAYSTINKLGAEDNYQHV